MVEYERTVIYRNGVGHVVVRPKETIHYKNGIGEGVTVYQAIESALNSPHPEERALLPQLAELKQRDGGKD